MASARAATAAAVAGLAAVAAWFATTGPAQGRHFVVGVRDAAPATSTAWQYDATGLTRVPAGDLQLAAPVTVAVIDTGADLASPDLAGRQVSGYAVRTRSRDVSDPNGHGTFVASLVAKSAPNARLLVLKAANPDGSVQDAVEASAVRYAVDHGARVINLSLAGPTTSRAERSAIGYAVKRGVLLVAAAGNDYARGNPVEYPAALLQPVGSNGRGGAGLVVAASGHDGARATFSGAGSWISLAAPGVGVLGGISTLSSPSAFPRATAGFGYGSGTSYAAPQVAGAAALVWGEQPSLGAREVARILEETASGGGAWTPDLGFGVLDVAAAVERAKTLSLG
jgi:serine protease